MWEREWATPPPPLPKASSSFRSQVDPDRVDGAYLLFWMEHCVECAVPDCYSVCPLYVARRDRKCARFRHGIWPNPDFSGLHEFGADVWFRRWGKLEARLDVAFAARDRHRELARDDRRALGLLQPVAAALETVDRSRKLNGAYRILRERGMRAAGGAAPLDFDEFLIEVHHPGVEPVDLVVEIHQDRLRFRRSLPLSPGPNLHRIPRGELNLDPAQSEGRVLIQPANDAEARLVFTWLDFVRWKAGAAMPAAAPVTPTAAAAARTPASRVKVVAWDLDRTLWNGILAEDGPDSLAAYPEALALIPALDHRGILQTIASKNDHANAWPVLERMGLAEYFVAPAINWGRKSANLRQIAEELNLGLDTFVLIDDSSFERGEVTSELPEVRAYAETEIASLLALPEFDVPVSAESRDRRLSYQAEGRRREIATQYGDDYDAFLRSCEMTLGLFPPAGEAAEDRCLELLQRSNQLNLSTRRYERDAFRALLADPAVLSLAMRCRDRYGDYGTVGFVAIERGPRPRMRDLVMSCRVAKKKVEPALFEWLRRALVSAGASTLEATFLPTARNGMLLEVLREVGFAAVETRPDATRMELDLGREVPSGWVVKVEAADFAPAEPVTPPAPDAR